MKSSTKRKEQFDAVPLDKYDRTIWGNIATLYTTMTNFDGPIRLLLKRRRNGKYFALITPATEVTAETAMPVYTKRWRIGVSRKGRIIQSVKVRPRLIDSRPRSLEGAVARKQDGKALRQHSLKGGCATYQVVTYSERRCSLVTRNPVAETVDNARRQQEIAVMGHVRCFSPAGYQRRHGMKDYAETGEALDARRRNHAYPVDPQKGFCYDEATRTAE